MLLKVDLEDLETVLNALYQTNEKELLMKFKTDAQNMIWAMSEGNEHLTRYINQWNDGENNLKMEEKIPQSFADFDLETAKKVFGLKNKRRQLFDPNNILALEPSECLKESLIRGRKKPLNTEKQRSESLISPVLDEVQSNNDFKFQVFSGQYVNIDKSKGLKGEFDFAFVNDAEAEELKSPVFTVVEAKTGDLTQHWGQVVAQMVGARELNRDTNNEVKTIFACLTTGKVWHFLKLENDLITIDEDSFYISELPLILGIFQEIVDFYKLKKLKS